MPRMSSVPRSTYQPPPSVMNGMMGNVVNGSCAVAGPGPRFIPPHHPPSAYHHPSQEYPYMGNNNSAAMNSNMGGNANGPPNYYSSAMI